MFLSNPEKSRNRYKEVTGHMSGYQSQLKGPRFAKKACTDLFWKHLICEVTATGFEPTTT